MQVNLDFWDTIENAWALFANESIVRNEILEKGTNKDILIGLKKFINEDLMQILLREYTKLGNEDLIKYNEFLKKCLYEIDRKDIHNYLEGSDDGFLYNRGFVIAMGKQYYDRIYENPSFATNDLFSWGLANLGCYNICFFLSTIYLERNGEEIPTSTPSIETGSNKEKWSQ